MEIYILRYVEPSISDGIWFGQTAIDLPVGYEIIHQQKADQLDKYNETDYSSPLLRCRLLADQISSTIVINNKLPELNFGKWKMKNWDNIKSDELNIHLENYITQLPTNRKRIDRFVRPLPYIYNEQKT